MARPKTALLTKEKVIDAAITLIGDGGLEELSMPKSPGRSGRQFIDDRKCHIRCADLHRVYRSITGPQRSLR
ncbi:MAG: hypothetical protein ACXWZL_09220 [Mycobacterium sp.]